MDVKLINNSKNEMFTIKLTKLTNKDALFRKLNKIMKNELCLGLLFLCWRNTTGDL